MEVLLTKERILSLMQEKRISKSHFADMMGIAKQNVDKLLDSKKKDINTIIRMSEVLDIPFLQLIGIEERPEYEGFIKKDGIIHEIKSEDDVLRLLLSDKTLEDMKLWKKAYEDSYGSDFTYDRLLTQLTASVEEGDPNVHEVYSAIKAKVVEDKEKAEEQEEPKTK